MNRGELVPAIVLGGGVIAVPVARSLGSSGIPVVALGFREDPVRASRHCRLFVDLGAGEGVQDRWLEWLRDPSSPRGLLLPCNDDALELLGRHRAELEGAGHRYMEMSDDVTIAMLDKQRTYALARQLGLPAPRTALLHADSSVDEAMASLSFPFALKPRHAHVFARHFAWKLKVVRDRAELNERWAELRSIGLEMLVTEVIPGPDDAHHSYYSYIDEEGRPLVHVTKHKLRQFPPMFGLTTYHEMDRNPEVMDLGLRFFQGIGIRGPACIEFKRDSRDGRLVVMECNARFTAGHEIVRHAGVDLALLAYNRAMSRPLPALSGYRAGVRMWHPVEDARTFLALRRRGELTLRQWLRSLLHPQHFPLLSLRDPGPSLVAWRRLARRAISVYVGSDRRRRRTR
jgi:D-aspartate ligase